MQESSLNKYKDWPKHEIFSNTCIPPETHFFLRLDGWKFKKLSESIKAEKPFDKKLAECLVSSGKTIYERGFNPALIYAASDELNILFVDAAPFKGRVEKIDTIVASLVSSAFTLNLQKFYGYGKGEAVAFDCRIVAVSSLNKVLEYLVWRQLNTWRNHNNAYAYWILRKLGLKSSEISKKLIGLKTEEIHELAFKHGVNLAKTPEWQRRGILIYKEPFIKKAGNQVAKRWRIKEDWNPPPFQSDDGAKLIKRILEQTRERENICLNK